MLALTNNIFSITPAYLKTKLASELALGLADLFSQNPAFFKDPSWKVRD